MLIYSWVRAMLLTPGMYTDKFRLWMSRPRWAANRVHSCAFLSQRLPQSFACKRSAAHQAAPLSYLQAQCCTSVSPAASICRPLATFWAVMRAALSACTWQLQPDNDCLANSHSDCRQVLHKVIVHSAGHHKSQHGSSTTA